MKNKKDLYGNWNKSGVTEIDLRKEFDRTIDGGSPEISKGQTHMIRRFRKDSDGIKIKCHCVDKVTGEASRETVCPTCLGEGFIWDEFDIELYHAEVNTESQRSDRESLRKAGIMNTPLRVFYAPVRYDDLTRDDKVVLLVLDKEGDVVLPRKREAVYKVSTVLPMRLDNGRLEFWKINGYEDNIKFQ